ncbi:MAG: succinoglycan biosynthesis protein ExoL [Rhodobacteraceae bacterium HLUCCO18]|nr:MAG: succinoglycan biosynthesis protein ExoL [Rhodobacteraceae bacterium HLUCCO18]
MASVVFFAFDIAEASQIRRIESLRALGHDVASVSFRKTNMNAGFRPDWRDLTLGPNSNHRYGLRLWRLLRALVRVWRHRAFLRDGDLWIARNLDMAVLAVALRRLTRPDVRIVYECLDIHGLFTRRDAVGRAMRAIERRILDRSDLLIVSSPGFLRAYFGPVQGYKGPVALVENKLWLGARALPRPQVPMTRLGGAPLTLGWVGSLRCARSLEILASAASVMGSSIRILFHGNVHAHAVAGFDAVLANHPNIEYRGAYRYPDDLAGIYGNCDVVWAQDLWQAGANSDWLLPNRIYEASYFGCPSIAVSGTETARRVEEDGLGFVLPVASSAALVTLLRGLDAAMLRAASARLLAMPASRFSLTPDELADLLAPVLSQDGKSIALPAE